MSYLFKMLATYSWDAEDLDLMSGIDSSGWTQA